MEIKSIYLLGNGFTWGMVFMSLMYVDVSITRKLLALITVTIYSIWSRFKSNKLEEHK